VHELSISSAVVDTAVRHAGGRPVTLVHLRVGHLRQVVPDSLEFYFGLVARETVCAGARLEIEVVPARLRCETCATEWTAEAAAFRCPACAGADVTVLAGEELEVESIELEVEDACTA
jgi:hydrogenase nickel incorporation protein HypA/HybF